MAIALSGSAGRLVALLAESPAGLPREQLIEQARARFRGQPVARITALIQQAVSAGAVTESAGLLRVTASGDLGDGEPTGEPGGQPDGESATRRPLRAVIVDLESVVRTTAREPYTEKRIYQLAARRAGADRAWAAHAPAFTRWLELPGDDWEIVSDQVRAEHAEHAAPAADALAALLEFTADADVIVAYNGVAADFPLLGEACDRAKLPRLPGEYVDAYYLALVLWPLEPPYRLAPLAAAVGIPVADLDWHDAAADCLLLDRLLGEAAARWGRWPASLRDGVASVAPDSPAWRLVRELAAGGTPMETERVHHHRDIAAIAEEGLADHRPRRPAAGRLTLHVGDSLRGDGGRVDAGALARVTNANATRRAAQDEMTTALHAWADEGWGGLIEAPTGTGKSLAVLAAALDWLAGGADRTAVISTYTKQLQTQLARDVADLDAAVPGLLRATDVVKGAGNRLSVRALLTAFADATAIGTRGARSRVNGRFVRQLAFRELLVYLLLRLLAAESRTDDWLAHSVDTVDVPPFFGDYVGPALPACLESLSQASGGDYADGQVLPVAAHTSLVPEALAGHRLIVSNHAMLLAHLGDLGGLGDETLLIIDEAHQLEDAATSALTGELDYQAVEDLLGESRAWLDEHRHLASWAAVAEAVRNLGTLLDHEQLPKVAGQAFDARSSGVGALIGSRAATLASPYIGSVGIPQVRTLAGLLTRLA